MRGNRFLHIALLSLFTVLILGFPALGFQLSKTYLNKKAGFKIRPPKDWGEMPLQIDEKWIVAKFESKKEYYDKEERFFPHRPTLRVLFFPKRTGGSIETEEKSDGAIIYLRSVRNPYKNYEDYLSKNYRGGGYYISSDKTRNVKGLEVRFVEIKVEKLARGGKKRLITWIFSTGEGKFAVQAEVLEDKYKKLKSSILSSFKTFSLVSVKKAEASAEKKKDPTPRFVDHKGSKRELTLHEKLLLRTKKRDALLEKAKGNLPEGWKVKRSKNYLVLSHASDKYTKRVMQQAEAVRSWLDKNLGSICKMHAGDGIIRICKDNNERNSLIADSSGDAYSSITREVTVCEDRSFLRDFVFEVLNRGILRQWLDDKCDALGWRMPKWLDSGLDQVIGTAVMKGKKLDFRPDDWEKRRFREGERNEAHVKLRAMFQFGYREFFAEEIRNYSPAQAASVVRYLLGPGKKKRKTKDFLCSYLQHTIQAMKKRDEKRRESIPTSSKPKTEEEEEKAFRDRKKSSKEEDKFITQETFKTFFKGWSEADWNTLERGWKAFSK